MSLYVKKIISLTLRTSAACGLAQGPFRSPVGSAEESVDHPLSRPFRTPVETVVARFAVPSPAPSFLRPRRGGRA